MQAAVTQIKKKKGLKHRGQTLFLVGMLTIPIVHWFVFWLYVNANSIMLAFQLPTGDWSLHTLQSALREFSTDGPLFLALGNTLKYFFTSILITMPCSFVLSYLFYKKILMYKVFRVILYMPAIISGVVITSAFSFVIAPDGPIGIILSRLGVDPVPEFLANSDYATGTILFYTVWPGIGTGTLLFQGGMARIPLEVLEAAKLDGCGPGRELVSLIIPLLWPTISTQLILQLTGLFGSSGPILLFTQGAYETTTLAYWIFDSIYTYGNYNAVSAAGLCCTVVGVPIILGIRWLIERIPAVEY